MMSDIDILVGRRRTLNISWTRCLGLARGRAGVACGRGRRAVHSEAYGAVAGTEETSEQFRGRCRSLTAEPHEQRRLRTIDRRSPVRSNAWRSFLQRLTAVAWS